MAALLHHSAFRNHGDDVRVLERNNRGKAEGRWCREGVNTLPPRGFQSICSCMHLFYHEDSSGVCDGCGVVPPPLPTLMVERRCATTTVVRPMIMRFRAS